MKKKLFWDIFFAVAPVLVVAGLGTLFVNLGMDWFDSLIKPGQWIPNFVIPIVWSVIYILTAVVIFLWLSKDKMPTEVWVLFVVNGVLNVLWCLLFFTLHLTLVGYIAIVFNIVFSVLLLAKINKYKPLYFWILLVYPTWILCATGLNLALWILN